MKSRDLFEDGPIGANLKYAEISNSMFTEFYSVLLTDKDGDQYGDYPSLGIYSLDGQKDKSERFIVYSFDREKASEMYKTDKEFASRMDALRAGDFEAMANRFHEVMSTYLINSREYLWILLTVEFIMPSEFWEQVGLGKTPTIKTGFETVGDIRVFFKSDVTKDDRLHNIGNLKQVENLVRGCGLAEILSGDIRFVKKGNGFCGAYSQSTGDVTVRLSAKTSRDLKHTLVHEFGHKLMHKSMNQTTHNILKHSYDVLQQHGIIYRSVTVTDSRQTSEWFQTGYSATDYKEWWAEMFAHYILDELDGEPRKFVKKILSER